MSLAHQIEILITAAAKKLATDIVSVIRQHVTQSISFTPSGPRKSAVKAKPEVEKESTLTDAQLSARRKTLAKARAKLAQIRKANKEEAAVAPAKTGKAKAKKTKKTVTKRKAVAEAKTDDSVAKTANGHGKTEPVTTA
jgi:hypothetical protein